MMLYKMCSRCGNVLPWYQLGFSLCCADKNGKCEEPARPFGRGGREGGVAAPCHEVSLRRKGQQKPAAWAFGRGGNRGCAPSIQEIQKFEFFGPGGVFFEEAAEEAEGAERGARHLCGAAAKESRVRRGESACG